MVYVEVCEAAVEEEAQLLPEVGQSGGARWKSLVLVASGLLAVIAVVSMDMPKLKEAPQGSMTGFISKIQTCSKSGEDCSESRCCGDSASRCFMKNEGWASCNATCSPHKLWEKDRWVEKKEKIWNCTDLTEEKPEEPVACTNNGENCLESRCCATAGSKCFKKNGGWASCNATCSSHMLWEKDKWVEKNMKTWDCDDLTGTKPDKCVKDGENCKDSRCCQNSGSKCFQKNQGWATCNATCSHHKLWEKGKWVEKKEKIWDCDVLVPPATS